MGYGVVWKSSDNACRHIGDWVLLGCLEREMMVWLSLLDFNWRLMGGHEFVIGIFGSDGRRIGAWSLWRGDWWPGDCEGMGCIWCERE